MLEEKGRGIQLACVAQLLAIKTGELYKRIRKGEFRWGDEVRKPVSRLLLSLGAVPCAWARQYVHQIPVVSIFNFKYFSSLFSGARARLKKGHPATATSPKPRATKRLVIRPRLNLSRFKPVSFH
jgi:hypothetical protein